MKIPDHWLPLLGREFSPMEGIAVSQITLGGSTRNFFRITQNGRSVILCEDNDRDQFYYYIRIGGFLRRCGVPVPELMHFSWYPYLALLEDGGPVSLQDLYERGGALPAYRTVLDVLVHFQSVDASPCQGIWGRSFGYDDYRWETAYFAANLLGGYLSLDESRDGRLEEEFESLARTLAEEPLHLMHRDFQSSNILVRDGRIFIIDFQGARRGPVHYDLASLLNDPYVHMPRALHDDLFDYYKEAASGKGLLRPDFEERYMLLSMQRLMQALGAYGFLGLVRKKERFLSYIPPALDLLERNLARVEGFPRLKEVVGRAASLVRKKPPCPDSGAV
jgi:aminoglycoside/choline kinase family phosphotransferase